MAKSNVRRLRGVDAFVIVGFIAYLLLVAWLMRALVGQLHARGQSGWHIGLLTALFPVVGIGLLMRRRRDG
jgi:uncharacterized membrane protein YhaH (DUF805 family)